MNNSDLKDFLEGKYKQYNNVRFCESDPISIPHLFEKKEDIEIAAFLSATIAWGQRPTIIRNAHRLVELMDMSPHDFLVNCTEPDFERFSGFVHRTFNDADCRYFILALSEIYRHHGGLETVFNSGYENSGNIKGAIVHFREQFLSFYPETRTQKHIANPEAGSTAKRINMFMRWMVRSSDSNVDFGLWDKIPKSALMMPIDVHSGNVARKLGLLSRKQNDWRAVEELTDNLRFFDVGDPVKYDFALFGLGVFEQF